MAKIMIPPGFDFAIALEAAELVVQAYAQFGACKTGARWSLPAEYLSHALLSARVEGVLAKPEPFGFVAQNKISGNVFVTFRGTDTVEDWLSNITIKHADHPWGPVEEGFWNLYQQCQENVRAVVKAAAGPQVVMAGHSLRGALATLATADLRFQE